MTTISKKLLALVLTLTGATSAVAADKALLDILLQNGVITASQYQTLMKKEALSSEDILPSEDTVAAESGNHETDMTKPLSPAVQTAINGAVSQQLASESPVKASYGSKGFHLETRDGRFSTNLQWRAQLRYTDPVNSDPRQLTAFNSHDVSNFEARRLRMKVAGHGFKPWIKYKFEVDLQPARDVDDSAPSAGTRLIDWRVDLAKWDWATLRLGQWKVDYNRERADSSGNQQFVERSIVNRVFTVDRQVGMQLMGRLFEGSPADLNYYAGIFNGEGRGVRNNSADHLYMARLQWNFMGRELRWRQTDVEYTEKPTGSFAIAGATNTGPCTRWSSSGCGNLDGFTSAASATPDQFKIEQTLQELAFKYRGFSFQQEWHRKFITDRVEGRKDDLTGAYVQAGYFFHNLYQAIPKPLELAARYAYVEEPNKFDRNAYNERTELTLGANWFFQGHNNKLTLDFSHLTLDDGLLQAEESDNRVRLQWDVSF